MIDNPHDKLLKISDMIGNFAGQEITLIKPRAPVGFWKIGDGFQVALYEKPTDEHIKHHQALLGWRWIDAEKNHD